jgi:hypothetical protein
MVDVVGVRLWSGIVGHSNECEGWGRPSHLAARAVVALRNAGLRLHSWSDKHVLTLCYSRGCVIPNFSQSCHTRRPLECSLREQRRLPDHTHGAERCPTLLGACSGVVAGRVVPDFPTQRHCKEPASHAPTTGKVNTMHVPRDLVRGGRQRDGLAHNLVDVGKRKVRT